MIIENIEIENFKSFSGKHKFTIDQPGLYFITGSNKVSPRLGANGVGKSTFPGDALYWAFTGRTLTDNRPAATVQSRGVKGSTSVSVKFTIDVEHEIFRSRRPNHLMLDGEEVDQATIDAVKIISDENLKRTLVLSQKPRLFLDLTPEDQSLMFTDMLSLQIWLDAADAARESAQKYEQEHKLLNEKVLHGTGSLDRMIADLKWAEKLAREFEADRKTKIAVAKENLAQSRHDLKNYVEKNHPRDVRQGIFDRLRADQQRIGDDRRELRKDRDKLIARRTKLKSDADRWTAEIQQLSESRGICPACGQRVSRAHIDQKIQDAKDTINDILTALDKVEAEFEKVVKVEAAIEAKLGKINSEYQEMEEDHRAFLAWESQRVKLQHIVERNAEELDRRTDEKNIHKDRIRELKQDIQEDKATLFVLKKQAEDADVLAGINRNWIKGFREIRLNLIDEVLAEVEVVSNRCADALGLEDWRIEFATERTTQNDRISRGFTTLIYPPDGGEPQRWESVSGGEEQRWRLAVTFALSEVLLGRAGMESNIEIIDEPTTHMAPEGIDDLLECLRERAIELGRAIYFIDHHAIDRGFFDGGYRTTRFRSGSRIERV